MLHTGLSLPFSSLSETLYDGRERRLRPYPCALILWAGAFPPLDLPIWCRRSARSCTVQVPREQPEDLLVRTWMSVLEDKGRGHESILFNPELLIADFGFLEFIFTL